MPSITDLIVSELESIATSYTTKVSKPNSLIKETAEKMRADRRFICTFTPGYDLSQKTMVAIDGGNAAEAMSMGDLMVAGASIGEAARSKPLYTDASEIPAEVYAEYLPHTSKNDKMLAAIRAALELRLWDTSPADIKIIDGAYLGNVNTVLYSLLDPDQADTILELNFFDSDGGLKQSIDHILNPAGQSATTVAVVKNDSSAVFVQLYAEEYDMPDTKMTDRAFATTVLRPGEFLQPRLIESLPQLISLLERSVKAAGFGKDAVDATLLSALLRGRAAQLRALRPDMEGLNGSLWTTYFKPSAWSAYAKAVKIEFAAPGLNTAQATQRAEELIRIVNQDIETEELLEPWSQFQADRAAKEVGHGLKILKNYLQTQADEEDAVRSFLRSYRS